MYFEISPGATETEQFVQIVGDFDENMTDELARLESQIRAPRVRLDCVGIKHINSFGVRIWCDFMKRLKGRSAIYFERCPTYFIEYAIVVQLLVAGGEVTSFFVPMRCKPCHKSTEVLVTSKDVREGNGAPKSDCKECGSRLTEEVDLVDYFSFLDADGT